MNPNLSRLTLAIAAALFASAAHAQAPAAPAATPGSAPAAATPPAGGPGAAAQPRPFKDVVKDAKETPGFFTLWQKDEKVWIEIKPEQLNMPFFMTQNVTNSIGERGLYGSQMGRGMGAGRGVIAYFKRIGNNLQLIAQNDRFRATAGTPQAEFVKQGFSNSLVAASAVVSQAHPERKSFLIEANGLLLRDIPMMATTLETVFRQPYAFDAANSSFTAIRNTDLSSHLSVSAHYAVPKLSSPPMMPSPVPMPPPPTVLPDARSMFMGYIYNFSQLPTPMAPRLADPRVGHFTTRFQDFTDDVTPTNVRHYINRWRLEKKDPAAAMSEPKQPIVFWMDKNIPMKYRKAVEEGILDWNKAFEKIGFKNAIVAKQQTEKDDFDTMDSRHASVRWFVGSDVGFAIGPSHVDPRTGEILDADIGMSDVFARGARFLIAEQVAGPTAHNQQLSQLAQQLGARMPDGNTCTYAMEAAGEMHFAMDLLEARGMAPDGPEAEAVAQAYVKDVIIHEVGHTLGLRHNFKSSTIYTQEQINNPEFSRKNAMAGSVMDYTPFNIAAKGEKQGDYVAGTIGPYDYWAIEYAYKPVDASNEKAELARIAARSKEPLLTYATDEDAGGGPFEGMDPEANRFDMTSDPIAFYAKRIKLSRELWDRLQDRKLADGESYVVLRRNFINGFNAINRIAPLATKYVGGVTHVRDHAGTGRVPFTPVPAAKQREALKLVSDGLLSVNSFKFKPEFLQRLGIDQLERVTAFDAGIPGAAINPSVSLSSTVIRAQRTVLDQLMSDAVAQRIVDSELQTTQGAPFKLSELYDTLQNAVWAELKGTGEIDSLRRNLQREHVKRVAAALLKPSATVATDVRSLQRENARSLLTQLKATQGKKNLSKETRAHLADAANSLEEALKAPMQRTGV